MLAIIAPGQGSQTPGMFNSWIQNPSLKELLISWSDAIGLDLLHLGTVASAEEIKDTANAQPLIVAASLLGAHALGIKNFAVTSGHSVGELAAAALSGAISESDALTIVRTRGLEMAKAATASPSGMSAVLGGDRDVVLAAITQAGRVAANDSSTPLFSNSINEITLSFPAATDGIKEILKIEQSNHLLELKCRWDSKHIL